MREYAKSKLRRRPRKAALCVVAKGVVFGMREFKTQGSPLRVVPRVARSAVNPGLDSVRPSGDFNCGTRRLRIAAQFVSVSI